MTDALHATIRRSMSTAPSLQNLIVCASFMPRVLLPNLMFEDELDGTAHKVPALARKSAGQLAAVMGLLASHVGNVSDPDDIVIVSDDEIPSDIPPALQHVRFETLSSLSRMNLAEYGFQPWGWSNAAIALGRKLGLQFSAPDAEVVRFVNSRQFLASRDDCRPVSVTAAAGEFPAGRLCQSMTQVSDALQEFSALGFTMWVIKSNLSQAARNRLCGTGVEIPVTTRNWLQKRFDQLQPVYVEPWFDRVAECGLQFHVPPISSEEPIEFLGGCEMLTDDTGRYRGSIVSTTLQGWWHRAIPRCAEIAATARQMGFFGPMGMDCMLVRHSQDEQLWLRPCHDVNGRFTMGRVALSLRHWLQPGEIGYWCHRVAKSGDPGQNLFEQQAGEDVRIIPTSPARYGSEKTTFQTAFLISADCGLLTSVVSRILSQNIRGPFDQLFASDLSTAANEKSSP
jgi:hypothetical protein